MTLSVAVESCISGPQVALSVEPYSIPIELPNMRLSVVTPPERCSMPKLEAFAVMLPMNVAGPLRSWT